MSFSNAPDDALLGRVAGALAVDEAFVEKDWFVVQAIEGLSGLATEDFTPVFSGGTSLLKAHGLIRRFSEDIDFKLLLSDSFLARSRNQRRQALKSFRDAMVDAWKEMGFEVTSCISRDEHRFIELAMTYPTNLEPHGSLRPHILTQISAKPPRLTVQHKAVASFAGQYARSAPEVPNIACIDPVETAADKLSAFSWRMLLRDRAHADDDPTIVRHLHDLAALEPLATGDRQFPALLKSVLEDDSDRGGGGVADLTPKQRLAAMREKLAADPEYAQEYARFVGGMAFAGDADVPGFDAAVAAVVRLCELLAD
uniref:Nucleotidyl transferase AbiEii/AbiGii toxin family protein n=2 Tax=Sphingomonadaceae TaxID=41297 RepID=A0A0D4ZYU4_9SPHN|nr:hypothetical protein plasmid201_136 [Sphingomonas sp. NS2]